MASAQRAPPWPTDPLPMATAVFATASIRKACKFPVATMLLGEKAWSPHSVWFEKPSEIADRMRVAVPLVIR